MFKITKEFSFCASHQLLGLANCHPCSKIHGHNYIVKVEMSRENLCKIGFVVDYRKMEKIKKYLDETVDHKHLNDVFDFNPTAENMANYFYHSWKTDFPEISAIEVSETPKTNARYEQSNH